MVIYCLQFFVYILGRKEEKDKVGMDDVCVRKVLFFLEMLSGYFFGQNSVIW